VAGPRPCVGKRSLTERCAQKTRPRIGIGGPRALPWGAGGPCLAGAILCPQSRCDVAILVNTHAASMDWVRPARENSACPSDSRFRLGFAAAARLLSAGAQAVGVIRPRGGAATSRARTAPMTEAPRSSLRIRARRCRRGSRLQASASSRARCPEPVAVARPLSEPACLPRVLGYPPGTVFGDDAPRLDGPPQRVGERRGRKWKASSVTRCRGPPGPSVPVGFTVASASVWGPVRYLVRSVCRSSRPHSSERRRTHQRSGTRMPETEARPG
jgi:hypothetical protein